MSRIRLKNGGKPRHKALFGADGAIMAAATLAAAGITAGATAAAAKSQAKAVTESAKTQAQSIKDQSANNTSLQKENISFTRQQNQENRQQQQDIQTTLQMLAGQENMNDRMEANKMQVRYGGRPKRRSLKSEASYGVGNQPFRVTDGGGAVPLQVDPFGYGLYELVGNDHEHYHKAPGGKNKTGVGIKFPDGSVVEGEGNQNTNQGELMYVTPQDAVFLSKHNIAGFNPTQAVKSGVHPIEAFNTQEILKACKGLADDGSRKRRSLGGLGVMDPSINLTQLPNNGTASVAGGAAYAVQPVDELPSSVARYGTRKTLKCGGRSKAAWGDYAGATYNTVGNLLGAGITTWGNRYAGKKLGQAYMQAGNILADAYDQMHGIDLSEIKREDYAAPHTLAVVRSANTNINPQLERIRRNSSAERREINRGTMSSAARQQRLAGTNDRMFQRMGEQYAWKNNQDEQIHQGNVQSINETARANADRDVQANKDYTGVMLQGMMYNNTIENAKISGKAQARADAFTQSQYAQSSAFQNSMGTIGSALSASGQGFASAFDASRKYKAEAAYNLIGMNDVQQIDWVVSTNDKDGARRILSLKTSQLGRPGLTDADKSKIQTDIDYLKSKFPNLK